MKTSNVLAALFVVIVSIGLNKGTTSYRELNCISGSQVNIIPSNIEQGTLYMRMECTDVTSFSSLETEKRFGDTIFSNGLTYDYWYSRSKWLMENDPRWAEIFNQ